MGVVGGPASTFNPYLYVRGNPVNLTDPSGRIAPPGTGVTLYSALGPSAILILCRADLRRNFGGL